MYLNILTQNLELSESKTTVEIKYKYSQCHTYGIIK